MKQVWEVSGRLVVLARSPREFNRAAMELGALVCRPLPQCSVCPVQLRCQAYIAGNPERTPRMRPRKVPVDVQVVCLAVMDDAGRYAVRKIPAGQWHAGMWEFPATRVENLVDLDAQALILASSLLPVHTDTIRPLLNLKYQVTHHKVACSVFHCHAGIRKKEASTDEPELKFLSLPEISALPLGSAQKKLLRFLEKDKGCS